MTKVLAGVIMFAVGGTILFILLLLSLVEPTSFDPLGGLVLSVIGFLILGTGIYLMMEAASG